MPRRLQMKHRRGRIFAAATTGLALAALTACSSGTSSSAGASKITMWHGYTDTEAKEITLLGKQWNAAHADQQVELIFNGGNDGTLQKTLASFVSGKTPGVAYEYCSPGAARSQRAQTTDIPPPRPRNQTPPSAAATQPPQHVDT